MGHPPGISVGLVTTSTGGSDFVLLSTPSFGQAASGVYPGAANSLAYVSPIVMSELQYDPAQPTAAETAAGYTDGDDFEFLELYNRSNTTQTLSNYYMGQGVGFSFGWVPDGTANESETLESGATATWTTTALAAGSYTVYADYSLTDPNGNPRAVDSAAQYLITYPGGSTTVIADQSTAVNGQLDLGPITTTAAGQVQVQLMRQSTAVAKPMDVGQPGGVRQHGRRRQGGQSHADLLRHRERHHHAGAGGLRGPGERLCGL